MTQPGEIVESPLERRSVQITLAVFVSVAFAWTFVSSRCVPTRNQASTPDRPGSVWADGTGAGALIQIDLNTAEPRELALLPGVGPILAKRIAANRDLRGPFRSCEDLCRVHGIGPKTLQQISHLCVVDPVSTAATRGGQPPSHQVQDEEQRIASAGETDSAARSDAFGRSGR